MPVRALYVYGVVRFGYDLDWQGKGIAEKEVYIINEGGFAAVVHDGEEKLYPSEDTLQIKEMILAHNRVLDGVMEEFGGVIPLPFNTIIKNGTNSARVNLKKWLSDDQEKLEMIWSKIKGKKEYGVRIYYEKEKLLQEASEHRDIKNMEISSAGKGIGLSYLLQGQAKAKTQEIFQEKVNTLKQEFYERIKNLAEDSALNHSSISLLEEKELLLSLSILIEEKQVDKVKEFLGEKEGDFPFHLSGPFAPYSFVENENSRGIFNV